jgi:glycine cleavage system H protein
MSEIPADLRYTASHEWVRVDEDGTVVVGITDHAQEALGELVFVEVPEEGAELAAGDACAVVESVKAASDIYAPITGVVEKINDALADAPELVNEQPYEDGWLMIITPADPADIEKLMTAEQYEESLEE